MKATYTLQRYEDKAGAWRWRIVCENNGEIVASCAEGDGYSTAAGALRAAKRLPIIVGLARIVKVAKKRG